MWNLRARVYKSTSRVTWWDPDEDDSRPVGITVVFETGDTPRQPYATSDVLIVFAEQLEEDMKLRDTRWLYPGLHTWVLDLDALKGSFPELARFHWLDGI